ncbi:MAG: SMP-30/gluconolactonase/LRE family protein [Candidatus Eremiobacteraeota bacterium]|nr:SMP-30/gluconolactonase/LRE family protein [Candidatus Eremiobacteraeota bacterium]
MIGAIAAALLAVAGAPQGYDLPTGQQITPLAAPGATQVRLQTGLRADGNADASGAMSAALGPDGRTLLVLTSGYNYQYFDTNGREIRFPLRNPVTGAPSHETTDLTQWIFVYHVRADGSLERVQRLTVPDAFEGIVWAPDGKRFYVSGGIDDRVAVYRRNGDAFVLDAPEILLGHDSNDAAPLPKYDGGIFTHTPAGRRAGDALRFGAMAAGLAVSADGKTLAVANMQNDSVSIVDTKARAVTAEVALHRPGSLVAHGEYPYGVAIVSAPNGSVAKIYAGSLRDGDVSVIEGRRVAKTVALGGEINALAVSRDGSKLYAVNGDRDEIDAIDTATDALVARIGVDRHGQRLRGANPNGIAIDARNQRAYVTLGGENAVAVVDLAQGAVLGRIPTGWYPTSIAGIGSAFGAAAPSELIVTDAKGLAGPNPELSGNVAIVGSRRQDPSHRDQYVLDLEKADLLNLPLPSDERLSALSRDVDENNGFGVARDPLPSGMDGKIKHVIFVMKENRTYDQVLGDLAGANGDPRLVSFPYAVAPNHHELAKRFVTFDNFYTSGDVSADGWNWSTQARANEYTTRLTPIAYASNGMPYDWNGTNRNLNTAIAATGGNSPFDARLTTLLDASGKSALLPGHKDIAATEGDGDESSGATGGYIWDAALRASKTVRQYGMYTDQTYYTIGGPSYIPIVRRAYEHRAPQSPPVRPSLAGRTDVYYRGWDLNVPDRFRYEEWKREFDGYVRRGDLPALEAVCLMMDHFGNFKTNVAGLNTPYLQMSDDDYALGLLVEAVSHSPYWRDTAIFVLEDDSQDGPDHVDSHRSIAYAISAYTRRNAVVHTRYTTVSMLKTIETLLGIGSLGIFDGNAPAMSDAFTAAPDVRDRYVAKIPGDLCRAPVDRDLIPECASQRARTAALVPRRSAAWWIAKTAAMDFSRPDAVDPSRFNALLQIGTASIP